MDETVAAMARLIERLRAKVRELADEKRVIIAANADALAELKARFAEVLREREALRARVAELEADAALGKMILRMPIGAELTRIVNGQWHWAYEDAFGASSSVSDTPNEAARSLLEAHESMRQAALRKTKEG